MEERREIIEDNTRRSGFGRREADQMSAESYFLQQRLDDLFSVMRERCTQIEKQMSNLITQAEFKPVRTIAFGFVGMILTAVVGALIALVIKPGPLF